MNDITVLPSYHSLDPREQGRLLFAQGIQIFPLGQRQDVLFAQGLFGRRQGLKILRMSGRHNVDQHHVGLMTLQVLQVNLPRGSDGRLIADPDFAAFLTQDGSQRRQFHGGENYLNGLVFHFALATVITPI